MRVHCGGPFLTRPLSTEIPMQLTITAASLQPIVALIAGIIILIFPKILNYVIALYLIVFGILGLFPHLFA